MREGGIPSFFIKYSIFTIQDIVDNVDKIVDMLITLCLYNRMHLKKRSLHLSTTPLEGIGFSRDSIPLKSYIYIITNH